MIALALALALGADAGAADARELLIDFLVPQDEARRAADLAQLRALAPQLPADQRAVVEKLTRFAESKERLDKSFPLFAEAARDFFKVCRGRFADEKMAVSILLSVPATAGNLGLDPAPYRKEAAAAVKDLAARYPNEGAAHGLLARSMLEAQAAPKDVLPELKRCAELEPHSWCKGEHARAVAELERPRCTGKALAKPLTCSRKGKNLLSGADYAALSVDDEGALNIELTPDATSRFARETQHPGDLIELKLGDEVLLSAVLNEPITNGRLRVTPGANRPPFKLDTLCRTVETPKVPDALKLK